MENSFNKENIQRGTRIYRLVKIVDDYSKVIPSNITKEMITFKNIQTKKDERDESIIYVFKSVLSRGIRIAIPNSKKGLVCFCKEKITDDVTHFIVDRAFPKHVLVHPEKGNKHDLFKLFPTEQEKYERAERLISSYIDNDFYRFFTFIGGPKFLSKKLTQSQVSSILEERYAYLGNQPFDDNMNKLESEISNEVEVGNLLHNIAKCIEFCNRLIICNGGTETEYGQYFGSIKEGFNNVVESLKETQLNKIKELEENKN